MRDAEGQPAVEPRSSAEPRQHAEPQPNAALQLNAALQPNAEPRRAEPRSALLRSPRFRDEPVPLPLATGEEAVCAAAVADERQLELRAVYAQGVAAGREEVESGHRSEIESAVERTRTAADAFGAARERLAAGAEVTIRQLAIEIAAQVMRGEVKAGRPLALTLAREAVSRLNRPTRLDICVHPADGPLLRGHLAQLEPLARGATIEVVEDAGMERGGCRVDGGDLVVDAELVSALAVIAEELGVGERSALEPADGDIVAIGAPGIDTIGIDASGQPPDAASTATGDGSAPGEQESSAA